jgi:energy-coupling factor transport system ATP-binding protein
VALTLSDASFAYAAGTALEQPALTGASLEVSPGELALVLGPSGSGKTTLLRLAAGMIAPTAGAVAVDGGTGPAAFRGTVGLAFQRPETQFFAETVLDDVAFGPRNLGRPAADAADDARAALTSVDLDPELFGGRSPFSLSGGEARRAGLAGIMAMRPRYLLLDEPTAGLDASGRAAVMAAVSDARATAGVVVVTHDPEEFLGSADRVVVLDDGRTAYSGSVAGLLDGGVGPGGTASWSLPEMVRAQMDAAQRAGAPAVLTLDPADAARTMMALGGRS